MWGQKAEAAGVGCGEWQRREEVSPGWAGPTESGVLEPERAEGPIPVT